MFVADSILKTRFIWRVLEFWHLYQLLVIFVCIFKNPLQLSSVGTNLISSSKFGIFKNPLQLVLEWTWVRRTFWTFLSSFLVVFGPKIYHKINGKIAIFFCHLNSVSKHDKNIGKNNLELTTKLGNLNKLYLKCLQN